MARFEGGFSRIFDWVLFGTCVLLLDLGVVVNSSNVFTRGEVSISFWVGFSVFIIIVIQAVHRVDFFVCSFLSSPHFFDMDSFPVSLLLSLLKITLSILLGSCKIISFLHNRGRSNFFIVIIRNLRISQRFDLNSVIHTRNSSSSVSKVSDTSWVTIPVAMPVISVKLWNRRLFRLPGINSSLFLSFVLSLDTFFNLFYFICFFSVSFVFFFFLILLFNLFLSNFFINNILYFLLRLFFFRCLVALRQHRSLWLQSFFLNLVNLCLLLLNLLLI